ncbi:Alkaline phosphatase [BD1-7 clade bacterium]|uniref:Alkaline phosphatase n=1 Tax=BD1-7 clade bacterium TaxID=2029982 RepID=A0A5S9N666_9GAMM|nr:Alkaline phosphatase [BD1-7 clade bacterium]CAA0085024.1 Alkaline phosphatase [BD1-7 clade bacterium]
MPIPSHRLPVKSFFSLAVGLVTSAACLAGIPNSQLQDPWFVAGQQSIADKKAQGLSATKPAKNVILVVGDGMSLATITAARILQGQQEGKLGEEHRLSFEKFPVTGLSKTYNTNQQTPDSAGTMTAMSTGVKTKAGMLSIADGARRNDCGSSKGEELATLLDLAQSNGKATGIVTTTRITHATPAALYANVPERDWESDDELSDEARENGCSDIAQQLIDATEEIQIDVVFGGGKRHFLPESSGGRRQDQQNLLEQWQKRYPQGQFVQNREQLLKAVTDKDDSPLLGLFHDSHMEYALIRDEKVDPSLLDMTRVALDKLQQDKAGFFLMVEGGRIDHGHHAGSAAFALAETLELADTVEYLVKNTDPEDTLIVVTSDHGHTLGFVGYPTRGNPILGKVVKNNDFGEAEKKPALANDKRPYTTLSYMNGPGFGDHDHAEDAVDPNRKTHAGRADLRKVDTQAPTYNQEAMVPLDSETHSGEDVAIFARGPGAILFTGVMEQNVIFHGLVEAAGWVK